MSIKLYTGTTWEPASAIKVYDGAVWQAAVDVKIFDGTAWQDSGIGAPPPPPPPSGDVLEVQFYPTVTLTIETNVPYKLRNISSTDQTLTGIHMHGISSETESAEETGVPYYHWTNLPTFPIPSLAPDAITTVGLFSGGNNIGQTVTWTPQIRCDQYPEWTSLPAVSITTEAAGCA